MSNVVVAGRLHDEVELAIVVVVIEVIMSVLLEVILEVELEVVVVRPIIRVVGVALALQVGDTPVAHAP